MPLAVGTRLGTYEILAPLGAGGMGQVYRARDIRLGRQVAVKLLPDALAASAPRLDQLEREARTLAGLNHPNIVTLYSLEDENGTRFITMELVEGHTLDALIAPGGLPLARVLELATPLLDALVAAHGRGIVHRDLKPGNLMVTPEDRLKVLDFGLADTVALAAPNDRTLSSEITADAPGSPFAGTVPYMAPEQIRGEPSDARSDLFAVGVILFELATGRRPFVGATPADLASAILRDDPFASRATPAVPVALVPLLRRCLEKSAAQRWPSASALGAALSELRSGRRPTSAAGTDPFPIAPPAEAAAIAVLPFVNRSRDEEHEYFSDGLADELLGMLAKIPGLRVAARSSSFQFRGTNDDVAAIGRKLNVATLLEGSVRRVGNRARISVQLVKVADGFHLWSEVYDRELDDIFAVQDDIARSVVEALRSALLGEPVNSGATNAARSDVARAAKGRSRNPEAHRRYLLARYHLDRLTREDTVKGSGHLREALALEPDFALAWAALGQAHTRVAEAGWCQPAEGFAEAETAILRALALEPDLAEAHAALSRVRLVRDWDLRGAAVGLERARQLAPGNAAVLRAAGELARSQGRFAEAFELIRRALAQDPLSASAHTNLGLVLHATGALAEAEAAYRQALSLAPRRVGTHAALALLLLAQGRFPEAFAETAAEPDEVLQLWASAIVGFAAGRAEESASALRELREKYAEDCAYQIAEGHAARGERGPALDWLERAYAQRDGGLITELKSSPWFAPLQAEPRWQDLLAKLGLEA